jgi:opacity protein-like surface antigen
MRGVLLAMAMFAVSASAHAADMPDVLRGSLSDNYSPTVNWRGVYVGGQGAWAYSSQTFNGSTMDRSVLPNTIAGTVIGEVPGLSAPIPLGTTWRGTPGYGAFLGYNWQWDEAVVGIEASYLHGNFGGSVSATQQFASPAVLSDGLFHDPKVTSTSTISVTDYATFRARAGYAYNCFLPYAFAGLALGYANVSTSAQVVDFVSASGGGPFVGQPPLTGTSAGQNHVVYGYTAGLGLDINLIGGLFMRGEWEYARITTDVATNINTVRAGLGYKF